MLRMMQKATTKIKFNAYFVNLLSVEVQTLTKDNCQKDLYGYVENAGEMQDVPR